MLTERKIILKILITGLRLSDRSPGESGGSAGVVQGECRGSPVEKFRQIGPTFGNSGKPTFGNKIWQGTRSGKA